MESPIPLADLESVLAWVDTYKLSRPTKKINRDFSDAVLLAEILSVHYPKLVEMHNYPPRNSHALKLNNWMTLNRKVLKKIRLTLCSNTMEQLANAAPGFIERLLVMVRDRIRRDEEINKSMKETDQNMSSGGSYYEACGDDESVLVVPVKTRVNGVLEIVHRKVICHEAHLVVKQELKDAKDCVELLKSKVEHLESMLRLKDERIEELLKQLERKQTRRKEVEELQTNILSLVDTTMPLSTKVSDSVLLTQQKPDTDTVLAKVFKVEESKIPIPIKVSSKHKELDDALRVDESSNRESVSGIANSPKDYGSSEKAGVNSCVQSKTSLRMTKSSVNIDNNNQLNNSRINENYVADKRNSNIELEQIKSDVFEVAETVEKNLDEDNEDFKDSVAFKPDLNMDETIQKEIMEISYQVNNVTIESVN